MIVFRRCATVMTVEELNSDRIIFWMILSVSGSIEAVASSIMRMRPFRSRALARHNNCRCPTDKFSPPSDTSKLRPPSDDAFTKLFKFVCSIAFHNSASLCYFYVRMVSYDNELKCRQGFYIHLNINNKPDEKGQGWVVMSHGTAQDPVEYMWYYVVECADQSSLCQHHQWGFDLERPQSTEGGLILWLIYRIPFGQRHRSLTKLPKTSSF